MSRIYSWLSMHCSKLNLANSLSYKRKSMHLQFALYSRQYHLWICAGFRWVTSQLPGSTGLKRSPLVDGGQQLQRILRLQYKIPENGEVSPQLRDLLSKILVDNPQQRLSMREIQQHPWYLQDLPEGVADMNEELPLPGDDVQAICFPWHTNNATPSLLVMLSLH